MIAGHLEGPLPSGCPVCSTFRLLETALLGLGDAPEPERGPSRLGKLSPPLGEPIAFQVERRRVCRRAARDLAGAVVARHDLAAQVPEELPDRVVDS